MTQVPVARVERPCVWATRAVASPRRSGSASPTPSLFPNLGGIAESLNAAVACAILMAQMLQNPNAATPRLRLRRCYSYLKSEKQFHWRMNSLTFFHVQNRSVPKTPVQRSFYIESILKER